MEEATLESGKSVRRVTRLEDRVRDLRAMVKRQENFMNWED
jgi:hypothetical protein